MTNIRFEYKNHEMHKAETNVLGGIIEQNAALDVK